MSEKKPETPAEWAAYRCQSSCRVGRDAFDLHTNIAPGWDRRDYAIYCLMSAVEDLSKQVELLSKTKELP